MTDKKITHKKNKKNKKNKKKTTGGGTQRLRQSSIQSSIQRQSSKIRKKSTPFSIQTNNGKINLKRNNTLSNNTLSKITLPKSILLKIEFALLPHTDDDVYIKERRKDLRKLREDLKQNKKLNIYNNIELKLKLIDIRQKRIFIEKLKSLGNLNNIINNANSIYSDRNIQDLFIENKYTLPTGTRTIFSDFTDILRKEGKRKEEPLNKIGSKIITDCANNYQNNKPTNGNLICFCCGEEIKENNMKKPIGVSCDHLLPILTMFTIVNNDSISNNLHYIHSECNRKKSDKNIFEVWKNLGLKGGIFPVKNDNNEKCVNLFFSKLGNLNIRPPNDIEKRHGNLLRAAEIIDEAKDNIKQLFDEYGQEARAADLLKELGIYVPDKNNPGLNMLSKAASTRLYINS